MFKQSFSTKRITFLAVFSAISFILYMFVKAPLPIFPFFLDMQISDFPALIAGFLISPIDGVIVVIVKILLKLPFTSTDFVGELADLMLGIAFVLPSSLVYRRLKTNYRAVIGLIVGSVCCVLTSLATNYFILVPFFVNRFFGGDLAGLANSLSKLYTSINKNNFYTLYLLFGVLPFNILRCIMSSCVTLWCLKLLQTALKKHFSS